MENTRRKIMIVDDNIANLNVARSLLKAHYDACLASSAAQMFEMLKKIRPEMILLDIEMPEMNGYEAIARLKADEALMRIPVMFLTAQSDEEHELKGLDLGAVDYVNKPFSPPLLLKRIECQLLIADQRETIQRHVNELAVVVSEKVGEVLGLQNAILSTVADLVEFRDKFTGGHITRTQMYLKALIEGLLADGRYADELAGWDLDCVLQSAQLHDVGKIGIPDAILSKPGRLDADEFETMKGHVVIGIDAVNRIIQKTNKSALLRHAGNIVGAHHERWDGTGYPYGLRGEGIPLEGRLMAVADVYDALVSWRPYKEKLSHEAAVGIIVAGRGSHFDPVIVDIFAKRADMFLRISSIDGQQQAPSHQNSMLTARDTCLGVPKIDEQHRELIEMINECLAVTPQSYARDEAVDRLGRLFKCLFKHFTDEQALHRQSGYPKHDWHRDLHSRFVEDCARMREDFEANGYSAEMAMKIAGSVSDWAVGHLKFVDEEFAKYYQLWVASRRSGTGASSDADASQGFGVAS